MGPIAFQSRTSKVSETGSFNSQDLGHQHFFLNLIKVLFIFCQIIGFMYFVSLTETWETLFYNKSSGGINYTIVDMYLRLFDDWVVFELFIASF